MSLGMVIKTPSLQLKAQDHELTLYMQSSNPFEVCRSTHRTQKLLHILILRLLQQHSFKLGCYYRNFTLAERMDRIVKGKLRDFVTYPILNNVPALIIYIQRPVRTP